MFATAEPQHSLFAHIGHNSAGCSGMRATCTACSNALRACPTMALGAEAPVPISFLMQDSEVPHTKSALSSFSTARCANADEDVATAGLVTPAFSVLAVIIAMADAVPASMR